MKTVVSILAGAFLAVSLTSPVTAGEEKRPAGAKAKHKVVRRDAPDDGRIPKAQRAYVQKREEARERRDRMLREREKNVK